MVKYFLLVLVYGLFQHKGNHMTKGYAAHAADADLVPFEFERRAVGEYDVAIEILYCGICHSDIHNVREEWPWNKTHFPIVPGHEIVGKVTSVGDAVSKFNTGDLVGVGCMVNACRHCHSCDQGLENYCENGIVLTYNSPEPETGGITYGGYSADIVVNQDFVLSVPDNLDLKAVAPLLCAGITMYSPLKHWGVTNKTKLGIIGLGGLGHMGVKLAHAMGAEVTMITTSTSKEADAKQLGADHVLLSTDAKQMQQQQNTFDVIINTIPCPHDLNPYISLLTLDGKMILVGLLENSETPLDCAPLIFKRRTVAGSVIGGIKETQEMLDFCGKHNIVSDVEMIKPQQINHAYQRMLKNDVKYRFVIDMQYL